MDMVTLEARITVPDDVLFTEVSGQAVILNTRTGKYHGLNEVGTRMWSLLAEDGLIGSAFRALRAEYDVGGDRLQSELLGLVDELVSHGLLQVDEK